MDEKLRTTIDKIIRLTKQNQEFNDELRKRLERTSPANVVSIDDRRFDHIEKYLGLDYYVDSKQSVIDYFFVEDKDVRDQLISDNREMMRFRYGTRYHEIGFDGFCRFAHLQAEMLLNYYYNKTNADLQVIKEHIRKYNNNAKGLDEAISLNSINYNVKLWSFCEEHKTSTSKNLRFLLDNLRKVRNEASHRSIEIDQPTIKTFQDKFRSMGFNISPNGKLSYEDNILKEKYKEINKSNDYKKYLYLLWYHSSPFDEIIEGLNELSNTIRKVSK